MPGYTPNSNIPYPLGTDPIRGTTTDNIRVDLQELALGADAGDVTTRVLAVEDSKVELQPRFSMIEELAADPGSRVVNLVIDPKPLTTVDTWFAASATLQQATADWGRAIASGDAAASVYARGGFGAGEDSKARISGGQQIAGRIAIRAMDAQKMSATLNIVGYRWDGAAFLDRTTLATSGQLHIEPGAINQVTFQAVGSVPVDTSFTHVELAFTFRRFGETYPFAGDFVYFRQAALYAGTVPSPVTYSDGDSAYGYWVGEPGASTSISMKPRPIVTAGADVAAAALAHPILLDDFTYRRGGVKRIGNKTSISFRIDHGLTNFNSKVRPKLEALAFKYALTLGSRDWGASENAGVSAAMVNGWVVGGLAEIWSHGVSHADADTEAKLRDYIVNSKAELQADIPAAVIDGFMPPGAGGTQYMGFGPSDSPAKYFGTLAGQLILQTYAIGTGNFAGTAYRVQDGRPRIGQSYFNMDTFDTAGVMSRVNTAISSGKGIQLMIHPSLMDTPGHITTAQLHSVMDQIKALETAGTVVVMSAYDQLLADSTQ